MRLATLTEPVNPSPDRIVWTQSLFREINDRVKPQDLALLREDPDALLGFVCECGSRRCTELMLMTLDEYERLRTEPTRFAVLPNHHFDQVERILERNERFFLIEKIGHTAEIASERAPR